MATTSLDGAITAALAPAIVPSLRRSLSCRLLAALALPEAASLSLNVIAQSLHALRILARVPAGADPIFSNNAVLLLASYARLHSDDSPKPNDASATTTIDATATAATIDANHTANDTANATIVIEALKCLANVLLQDAAARSFFASSPLVLAAARAIHSASSSSIGSVFLLSRLLFLSTIVNRQTSLHLLTTTNICNDLARLLDDISSQSLSPTQSELAWVSQDATIIEILKLAFNLTIPLADLILDKPVASPFLFPTPPAPIPASDPSSPDHPLAKRDQLAAHFRLLLATVTRLLIHMPFNQPPLAPPHSHMINILMNIPVRVLEDVWIPGGNTRVLSVLVQMLEQTFRHVFPRSKSKQIKHSMAENATQQGLSSKMDAHKADASGSECTASTSKDDIVTTTAAAAAAAAAATNTNDTDSECDAEIDGVNVDQAIPPLLLVLKTIASESNQGRIFLKTQLMPETLDRTRPLHHGDTVTSYMIGMMSRVGLPQIRECVGELMYRLCGEDVGEVVGYVGYGHAAGFLMNRGLMGAAGVPGVTGVPGATRNDSAVMQDAGGSSSNLCNKPMDTSTTLTDGVQSLHAYGSHKNATVNEPTDTHELKRRINPITGEYERERRRDEAMREMTDEEKEREGERLYGLIERLNRTGVIQMSMPGIGSKE